MILTLKERLNFTFKKMTKTNYLCPICQVALDSIPGDSLQRERGFTVYCGNLRCPTQEIRGYGQSEEKAYQIILEKVKSGKKNK